MSSTATLIVDIIGSKELASQPGGHASIHELCQGIRTFLDSEFEHLNRRHSLDISQQNPQGDDVQYRLDGASPQEIANVSLAAVIAAFSSSPVGKRFRYIVYTLEANINYQPRIKTFGDISKTEEGKRHHIAVERSLVSSLTDSRIINWLETAEHLPTSLELRGEPWTGVHVDLYCTVRTGNDERAQPSTRQEFSPSEISEGASQSVAATTSPEPTQRHDELESKEITINEGVSSSSESPAKSQNLHKHVLLSDEDRRLLCDIVESAELPRKSLAEAAGVSPAWLSHMLSGQSRRIEAERLARVSDILAETLNSTTANDKLSEERAMVALRRLSRFSSSAARLVPPRVYPPGGPVPIDSGHYVKRKQDAEISAALQRMPFTMLVRGPVQCGKSSFLGRLQHQAIELGIETAWFDPRLPIDPLKGMRNWSEINATAVAQLAELLQASWGLASAREEPLDSSIRLVNWLLRAIDSTRERPRLLIIDDLVRLGAQSIEDWLNGFVRAAHNARAIRRVELNLAIGISYHFADHFQQRIQAVSSAAHWWPRIEFGWFSRDEVNTLADKLGATHTVSETANTLFAGQPFLTHSALTDPTFLERVQRWVTDRSDVHARDIRLTQAYKRHLAPIRFAMTGPTLKADLAAIELVDAFAGACSGFESDDSDHGDFFSKSHLVREGRKPAIPIYRLMSDDLREAIHR